MGVMNIAVIISGIDQEYQGAILSGIHKFADEHNINVAHFVAFGGVLGNKVNDIGEFNIYNLINYDQIDGAILLTNTISSPENTQIIIDNLKKADVPASSIDYDIDGLFHVGIDNEHAMREVVSHVIEFHGIRDVNYISGPATNPESILRLNAFKTVISKNGIKYDETKVYHGLFRERDGRNAVEKFIADGKLQKAIICANDAMAIGAVSTLMEKGLRVPEDVLVTGFDNIYNAQNYCPQITSVGRPLRESGYIACSQVYNAVIGMSQERSIILDTNLVVGNSCGCNKSECDDIIKFKRETYQVMERYHHDVPMINQMSCNLTESATLEKSIENLKQYIEMIKCEKFFLCLCDNWDCKYDSNCEMDKYTVYGYTEMMQVPLVYCDQQFGSLSGFFSHMMLPDLYSYAEDSKLYYFSPLHFNDRCLGYAIICNSEFPLKSPLFHTWIMNISNSIENVRKLICIERVLKKVESLYVIDPLSQIYNRNGFHENTEYEFNRCINEKLPVMLMFADMDGMKYINDNFGHKEGDYAIKIMAQAVSESCTENEICARFGGDEFIIFGVDYSEEKAIRMFEAINHNLYKYNKISGKPYQLEVSIGWHIEVPDDETKFNSLIMKADQKMYREKKKKPNRRKRD